MWLEISDSPKYSDQTMMLVWLTTIDGLGAKRIYNLCLHFADRERLWTASYEQLRAVPGIGEGIAHTIVSSRDRFSFQRARDLLVSAELQVMTLWDTDYPPLLRNIANPPVVLYVRGNLCGLNERPIIAIVGTRRPTGYGQRATAALVPSLVKSGAIIVSGLARGIDRHAHEAVLRVGGLTVGVLGSGHLCMYPKDHHLLASRMAENGAVISEYFPTTPPHAGNFPARNRIISGLSHGVVVVEAGERSGALITVDHALEQNRDVFAVPGPITEPNSVGPHRLIQQGAKLVISVADIIEEYPVWVSRCLKNDCAKVSPPCDANTPPGEQEALQDFLRGAGATMDEMIARFPGLGPDCHRILLQWVLEGSVVEEAGGRYVWVGLQTIGGG